MRRAVDHAIRGATIVEAVFAGAIMALFMGGLFEMNARNMQMLKAGKESFAATVVLEERMEQLRSGTWRDITTPGHLQAILGNPPSSASQLPGFSEQISITKYPPASPAAAANTVTRSSSGAVAVTSSNPMLPIETVVRADLRITWPGTPRGRTRVRELSTVIAERGLITR